MFPAPVYARGFLRTYARYLGLNPEELLRVFPNGELTVDITPLPTVSRPPSQLINVNWLVAVLAVLFLGGAALLLLNSGDGSAVTTSPRTAQGGGSALTTPGQGAPLPSLNLPIAQGKVIGPVRPGVFPDFVGADKPSAEAVLRDNDISYIIVESVNKNVAKGLVISQAPAAGAKAAAGATITLYVSAGPS